MTTEKTKINRIAFVIDRSGSMRPIMQDAIAAFNDNLRAIKEQVAETGQDATVTLITFDNEIETVFFNRSIGSIQELGPSAITPRGMTALFDATAHGITQMQDLPVGKDEDVSYLINVITDGEENESRMRAADLNALMRRVQATDIWTLTFLVPKGGRRTLCSRFGVPEGNVMEWTATAAGVKQYAAANRGGIQRFFKARAAGQQSVKSFYTDLTNVSARDVRELEDLSGKAVVLDVTHDDEIRSFVESTGRLFLKGAAFYELVGGKDNADKVQDYKKVLIMEKGRSQVYGGDDARRLLDLPDHETKVRPGDHGGFRIFIQSTSVNRKVRSGTRIIYMPADDP